MAYDQVTKRPQLWTWRHWVPRECMVLLAGGAGIAKGRTVCDLIGRETRGWDMPDGSPLLVPPGDVISITGEDQPDTAMAWRLDAAGADRRRVHDLTWIDGKRFKLDDAGFKVLHKLAARGPLCGTCKHFRAEACYCACCPRLGWNLVMVYLDPLTLALPCRISDNLTARDVVVDPCDAFARKYRCAWLTTHHTVKDGSIAGSQGLVDACRHVLFARRMTRKGEDHSMRELSIYKSNIGPDDLAPLRYTLEGTTDADLHVAWPSEAVTGAQVRVPTRVLTGRSGAAGYDALSMKTAESKLPPAAEMFRRLNGMSL